VGTTPSERPVRLHVLTEAPGSMEWQAEQKKLR
jgi:hypothetical protein